jgi:hypothetical protein
MARSLLLAALLCVPVSVPAAEYPQAEYQVKAAFLYNFARFTSWPEHTSSVFKLCILGDDPFGEALDALTGKMVHGEILMITRLVHPSELDGCELVYISTSHTDKLDELLALLREQAVLTVSDIDAFIDHGGIIGFRIVDNKVRFEINTTAAARAGLSISSKLLSLANRVSMER